MAAVQMLAALFHIHSVALSRATEHRQAHKHTYTHAFMHKEQSKWWKKKKKHYKVAATDDKASKMLEYYEHKHIFYREKNRCQKNQSN